LKSNGLQVHSPTSHRHQNAGQFGLRVGPMSTSINAESRAEMEVAPHEHSQMFAGQDDTVIPPASDDALQPTALRQLQEYTSPIGSSSLDDSERSTSSPQIHLSPIFLSSGVMLRSHSPERFHSITSYVPNQKRKLADSGEFV